MSGDDTRAGPVTNSTFPREAYVKWAETEKNLKDVRQQLGGRTGEMAQSAAAVLDTRPKPDALVTLFGTDQKGSVAFVENPPGYDAMPLNPPSLFNGAHLRSLEATVSTVQAPLSEKANIQGLLIEKTNDLALKNQVLGRMGSMLGG